MEKEKMRMEKEKTEIYNILDELEKEIEILKENIKECRKGLESVKTEDDILNFSNRYDLERGLNSIILF